MNPENADESIARTWLESQNHKEIKRPDEDPPDFEVDGKYAVEVMRVSSLIAGGGSVKAEEEILIPLADSVRSALESLGPPANGRGWVVDCEFDYKNKPRPRPEVIRREILHKLSNFQNISEPGDIELRCGIRFTFCPWRSTSFQFELNNVSDEMGVWVSSEFKKSIPFCINKKCEKVARRVEDFPAHEWWLLLIDHILRAPARSYSREAEALSGEISTRCPFSRVVIISSGDPEYSWELSMPQTGDVSSSEELLLKPVDKR